MYGYYFVDEEVIFFWYPYKSGTRLTSLKPDVCKRFSVVFPTSSDLNALINALEQWIRVYEAYQPRTQRPCPHCKLLMEPSSIATHILNVHSPIEVTRREL